MSSQQLVEIAAPSWGPSRSAKNAARATAVREARRARPDIVLPPPRLDLRVRAPRLAGAGLALAVGFALLWAFLLLGVAAPAGTLG
jgi:hypothetical protein